jgi:hypothetical protein
MCLAGNLRSSRFPSAFAVSRSLCYARSHRYGCLCGRAPSDRGLCHRASFERRAWASTHPRMELRLASERSERLSSLERDAEDLLEAYEERSIEALEELSPEERRGVYKLLDLTVEAYPDGRLEAAWALNASVSKVRPRSRSTFQPAKDDLASAAAPTVRLKRVFSQDRGCWSEPEVALG